MENQNMKTLQSIVKEISESEAAAEQIRRSMSNPQNESKEYKRLMKSQPLLIKCQQYLETHPREEFIQKQLDDLLRKKTLINEGFGEFLKHRPRDNKSNAAVQSEYYSQTGMKQINFQIKTLRYILN